MITPGEAIRQELDKRGWTQADLAKVVNRPLPTINEIIGGKRAIMPEMAIALGAAFENDPSHWMKLEADYRLSLAQGDSQDIQRRAKLYKLAPVKEMMKREWIKATDDAEIIEQELCRFFNISTIDESPAVTVSTRKSDKIDSLSQSQRAWCVRARQLANALVHVGPFDPSKCNAARSELRRLAAYPSEAKRIPEVMAKYGVRFVVIEPLTGAKIDGAAFWLAADKPVIAVSARYDRVDALWFTVMHEWAHIENGDSLSVDTDLGGDEQAPTLMKDEIEQRADKQASESLIDPEEIQAFVRRVSPLYSKDRIVQFAHRIKIHPGIIVGQLQHRGEISFRANREMLAKVRDHLVSTALTDGWGSTISRDLLE